MSRILSILLLTLLVRPALAADDKGWTQLFNGKDLSGWKTHADKPGQWVVEDGAIVSRGDDVSHLFSERGDFENFHLRVTAQINAPGDSGVIFRSEYGLNRLHRGKTGSYPNGYEAQIQLSGTEKSPVTGSVIDFAPFHDRLVKPDAWFTLEVIAEGKHIVVKVDGKITADFNDEKHTYAKGHFALQQHDAETVVKFRKIEVKDILAKPALAKAPPAVHDLIKFQTGIRNQGGRDTCPYFPPVAALEAAYAHKGIKVELSEEHLIWLRNVACSSDKEKRDVAENLAWSVGGGNGVGVLKQFAICRAADLPYHFDDIGIYAKKFGAEKYDWSKPFSQFVLNRWNFDPRQLPAAARVNAKYAIEKFASIAPQDLRNPAKYEEVLAAGHEIIFSVNIHGNSDDSAIGQPVWRLKPNTPGDSVNHFMLIVGYDHRRKFFVVKNQWGPTNYTAMKKKLAAGWKDVTKYDGFTLVDYNYLETFAEAHYITEVAEVGSPRFTMQRALGLWQVSFKQKDKEILAGVLTWRHLPTPASAAAKADWRIGDLSTKDGQQYRVNAKLEGDGTKPFAATLFIDFEKGIMPSASTGGTAWTGTLTLPENGKGTLELKSAGGAKQKIKNVDSPEISISAALDPDHNLLKGMPAPR